MDNVRFADKEEYDFKGCSLLVTTTSIDHIDQHAIYFLLLNSQGFKHVGLFKSEHIVSQISKSFLPQQTKPSTGCDLYFNEKTKQIVLFMRSTIVKGERELFMEELGNFIEGNGIALVSMFTAAHPIVRTCDARRTQNIYAISSEENCPVALLPVTEEEKEIDADPLSLITGGGLTKSIVKLCREKKYKFVCLVSFAEGDTPLVASELAKCWSLIFCGEELSDVMPEHWCRD
eukprot:TRINITY_DN778276_c0_g1_i1.p1 TRINITY_DN778276_c0_g1~~TRINITY_DN778276_c0_g1_i1.p1  ORF type:complete len:232 (-),score=63.64 TRINITY_DN778276_c0_g1_i1:87-782(-)